MEIAFLYLEEVAGVWYCGWLAKFDVMYWEYFVEEFCHRFGEPSWKDVIKEFNKLSQTSTIFYYQQLCLPQSSDSPPHYLCSFPTGNLCKDIQTSLCTLRDTDQTPLCIQNQAASCVQSSTGSDQLCHVRQHLIFPSSIGAMILCHGWKMWWHFLLPIDCEKRKSLLGLFLFGRRSKVRILAIWIGRLWRKFQNFNTVRNRSDWKQPMVPLVNSKWSNDTFGLFSLDLADSSSHEIHKLIDLHDCLLLCFGEKVQFGREERCKVYTARRCSKKE